MLNSNSTTDPAIATESPQPEEQTESPSETQAPPEGTTENPQPPQATAPPSSGNNNGSSGSSSGRSNSGGNSSGSYSGGSGNNGGANQQPPTTGGNTIQAPATPQPTPIPTQPPAKAVVPQGQTVWVAPSGTVYHTIRNCQSIVNNANVKEYDISEVANLPKCKHCTRNGG